MAEPSKWMHMRDKALHELLQDNKCSDISESKCSCDRDMNFKLSSSSQQTVNSDDEDTISDESNTDHGSMGKVRY
jgi:hypothetical protein